MRVAICALVLVLAGVGRADEAALKREEAKHHFEEATAAFNVGDFSRAADEYREAYKIVHDPVLLYDAAQACRLGNDPQQAVFLYRSYLRSAPNAPNRKQVEDRITTLDQELATRTPAPPPPARSEKP